MKFLITGANGQLAGEFINFLQKANHELIALGKDKLDISHPKAVSEVISQYKPDVVLNCAAYNDVDNAEADWNTSYLINGIGVKNLALSCNRNRAILVHFSTDYVFDGLKEEPYTLADRPNPINKYGESKLLGEEMLKNHAERYYLIRVSWVFGGGKQSFPRKLIEWTCKSKKLRIVDDQVSVPSYTADLVRAVTDLLKTEEYGLYHITNSGSCSRYEWAKFILKIINWDGELEPAKSEEFKLPAKRPQFSVLDNFPIKETIGCNLPDWQDATERFLAKSNA